MGAHSILRVWLCATAVASALLAAASGAEAQAAQAAQGGQVKPANLAKSEDSPRKSGFFDSEAPLELTLKANFRALKTDKGETPPWRTGTMSYAGTDGKAVSVPLKLRTRGIWRLKNCVFPPVRLNFAKPAVKGTSLAGLDKPKLVSYCRDADNYEEYVLQEFQLYRVYRLLTPTSHRVRLVRTTYADSASSKVAATRYAFIMEELEKVAARAGGKVLTTKGARAGDLEPHHDALIGVFEYFIGNTDFSLAALHNTELIQLPDGTTIPVAYDFDFSGAVNSRYATVDPTLNADKVRDRLFRGFCVEPAEFAKVFALFNEKKAAIYALYRDDVGRLLQPRTVSETLKYFDEFYRTINSPRAAKREILDNCRRPE